jgi:hypothetical protein
VFLDCAAGVEAVGTRTLGSETLIAPVSGTVVAGAATLVQGNVRLEEAGVEQPALVAGADGAQLVVIFADRRALRTAIDDATLPGALAAALAETVPKLLGDLALTAVSESG